MAIDPSGRHGVSPRARLDWRRVLFWASFPAFVLTFVAAVLTGIALMPLVPKDLGRTLTEGFLRTFLVGYASALIFALISLVSVVWILVTNRRGFFRRKYVPRILLSGATLLICMILAEVSASAWLGWIHRFPSLPTTFPEDSWNVSSTEKREMSLVVIGGSAALGYPYNPHLSIGQIVGKQIERLIPDRTVRVNVLAKMGANLERMHQELAGLKRRPDVMIINSGNNEFLARFEPQRNAGLSEASSNPFLGRLHAFSLRSPLCRLVYETISKNRLGGKPIPVTHPKFIDPPVFTPSEFDAVLNDVRQRLEAIVSYCERIGCVPILVIPPCNESGYEPNRNVLPDNVTLAERDELTAKFETARRLEATDPSQAVTRYRQITERWPDLAESHFRLARLLESAGDWDEARKHYRLAKERDGFPIRELDVFQEAYRDVAKQHGCILVDGPRLFESVAPHGIVGDDYFHDAHHPTLRGHAKLAEGVLNALREHGTLGWTNPPKEPIEVDLAACIRDYAITPKVWDGVCAYTSTFYRDLANIRFDPSERRAKQKAYEDVRPRIMEGAPPDQLGIPGMGLVPPGTLPLKWWEKLGRAS